MIPWKVLHMCAVMALSGRSEGRIFVNDTTADLLEPGRLRVVTYDGSKCVVLSDVSTGPRSDAYWTLYLPRDATRTISKSWPETLAEIWERVHHCSQPQPPWWELPPHCPKETP